MYFNLNTILIILPWQCLTITWAFAYTSTEDPESGFMIYDNESYPMSAVNQTRFLATQFYEVHRVPPIGQNYDPKDCHIPMDEVDINMPIPFTHKTKPPLVIYPDRNGFLNIKHLTTFKLACLNNGFSWPRKEGLTELSVMCFNETYVLYRRQKYSFKQFKCNGTPPPKFVVTVRKCQGSNNTFVGRIGFQTRKAFLTLYKVCFDTQTKNTIYAWYQLRTPKCYRYQSTNWSGILTKKFYSTKSYGNVNISAAYDNQKETMLKIIESKMLANYYIVKKPGEVRFLAPGYLLTTREFPYHFQHQATAYYENTVPMWYKFHMLMWRRIQEAVDRILITRTSKRYLVLAGTYGTFELHDKKVQSRAVYLYLPKTLSVPKFIWKLVYNYNVRKGTVFIGLNTAFQTHTKEKRICRATMCPGFSSVEDFKRAHVYCCSKNSFELAYGRLDSYVYHKF